MHIFEKRFMSMLHVPVGLFIIWKQLGYKPISLFTYFISTMGILKNSGIGNRSFKEMSGSHDNNL